MTSLLSTNTKIASRPGFIEKKLFAGFQISLLMLSLVALKANAAPEAASASPTTATPAATATEKKLSVESGKVEFLAIGKPSFLKVNGTGSAPKGQLTIKDGKASGEFSFELATLDTKNETRTKHMNEKYLEVEKYPTAKITFKDVPAVGDAVAAEVPAELTLHGQTKPVTLTAKLDGAESKKANGTFKIKLSEYGIAIPSYAGVTIADEVTVTIESQLK